MKRKFEITGEIVFIIALFAVPLLVKGTMWMKKFIDCPECDGNGTQEQEVYVRQGFTNDYGFPDSEVTECRNCAGTGKIEPLEADEWH